MSGAPQVDGVELRAPWRDGYQQVLTADAGGAKVFMADFEDSNTSTFDITFRTLPAYERLA